jgi:hypothetical protein
VRANEVKRVVVRPAVHIVDQREIELAHDFLVIVFFQCFFDGRAAFVQTHGYAIDAVRVNPRGRRVRTNVHIGFVDDVDEDLEQLFFSGGF